MLCFVIVVDLQQIRGGFKEKIVPFDGAPGRSLCFVLQIASWPYSFSSGIMLQVPDYWS